MLRILEYWNSAGTPLPAEKESRRSWKHSDVVVCGALVAMAIGLDCATGVRYNPTLIYVIVIIYVSWSAPASLSSSAAMNPEKWCSKSAEPSSIACSAISSFGSVS